MLYCYPYGLNNHDGQLLKSFFFRPIFFWLAMTLSNKTRQVLGVKFSEENKRNWSYYYYENVVEQSLKLL